MSSSSTLRSLILPNKLKYILNTETFSDKFRLIDANLGTKTKQFEYDEYDQFI
jgi:hypothetical protein